MTLKLHTVSPADQAAIERGVPHLRAVLSEYDDVDVGRLVTLAKQRVVDGVGTPLEFAYLLRVFKCLREEASARGISCSSVGVH